MTAYTLSDTIIAPATALAEAAIGVLRLSGPDAWRIAAALCEGLPGTPQSRKAYVVTLLGRDAALQRPESDAELAASNPDEARTLQSSAPPETVVLTLWRGPRSYTGEDMAELSLHGNPLLIRAVIQGALELAHRSGLALRPAEAGEFTYRAFLNGKLDLAQAEAVQQVISASSRRALELAQSQLAGAASRRVRGWVERLVQLLARIEVTHDYGADDLDATLDPALLFTPEQLALHLEQFCAELAAAQDEARRTAPLRSGITVAICGPPNVGKSTLFNVLLGQDRALTAAQPGTTRDYLTESLEAEGLRLTLVDTAGYRDTEDAVEAAGVRRAGDWARAADILLWVEAADTGREHDSLRTLEGSHLAEGAIRVVTRCDLLPAWPKAAPGVFHVSGKTGQGIAALQATLTARAAELGEAPLDSLTERQAAQASQAEQELRAAQSALAAGMPLDAAAQDIYSAVAALRQVYEHPDREAVVQAVFSGFCVGK